MDTTKLKLIKSNVILLCSRLPGIKSYDDDLWNKIKCVHCVDLMNYDSLSIFKNETMHHKGLNNCSTINKNSIRYRQIFMSMIINLKIINSEKINVPTRIISDSEYYRKKCDLYMEFISDYFEKSDNNDDDPISLTDLYQMMRQWYRLNIEGTCPSLKELRKYIMDKKKLSYDKKSDSLIGYRIRTLPDFLDELANI